MKKSVILTVPHAVSSSSDIGSHPQDYAAPGLAQVLQRELEASGYAVHLEKATLPRSEIDMNRPWSRPTSWRKAIVRSGCHVHIDIHSYPPNYRGFTNMDIAVVCRRRPTERDARLASRFATAGIRTGLVVSPGMIDISSAMSDNGVASVMIEISEGMETGSASYATKVIVSAMESNDFNMSSPCTAVNGKVHCCYVDHMNPSEPIPLWFPPDDPDFIQVRKCAVCGSPNAEHVCGACACVAYCSEECEQQDWNARKHYLICALIAMPPKALLLQSVGNKHQTSHTGMTCTTCDSTFVDLVGWKRHANQCYRSNIGRP